MWKRLLPPYRLRRKSENPSIYSLTFDQPVGEAMTCEGNKIKYSHNIGPNNMTYQHTSHYVCTTQPSTIFHSFKIPKLLIILHLDVIINLLEFLYYIYAQHQSQQQHGLFPYFSIMFVLLNPLQFHSFKIPKLLMILHLNFVSISLSFCIVHIQMFFLLMSKVFEINMCAYICLQLCHFFPLSDTCFENYMSPQGWVKEVRT